MARATPNPEKISKLGEQVAKCIQAAEDHEARAAKHRAKAQKLAAQLGDLTARAVRQAGRRVSRDQAGNGARQHGVTDAIRTWAKGLGEPFSYGQALEVMRRVHPEVTNGSFYHLLRRGDIKKVRRGLFVHPDYYAQFAQGEVVQGEGANGDVD